jgi:hypothetical protein
MGDFPVESLSFDDRVGLDTKAGFDLLLSDLSTLNWLVRIGPSFGASCAILRSGVSKSHSSLMPFSGLFVPVSRLAGRYYSEAQMGYTGLLRKRPPSPAV